MKSEHQVAVSLSAVPRISLVRASDDIGAATVSASAVAVAATSTTTLDAMSFAGSGGLGAFAGGVVTAITPSHWIVLMTFLLALFLGFAKRRDDLLLSAAGCEKTRRSLDGYNLEFVSAAMIIMAAVVIVSYILYTVSPEVIAKHGSDKLYLTAIFVIMGVLRYLQITLVECKSGSPTLVLLRDGFIQACLVLWIASCYVILYVEQSSLP